MLFVPDPNDIAYRKDHIRIEDASVRMAIHLEFLSFLDSYKIPYAILQGDEQTRLTKLQQLLGISKGQ